MVGTFNWFIGFLRLMASIHHRPKAWRVPAAASAAPLGESLVSRAIKISFTWFLAWWQMEFDRFFLVWLCLIWRFPWLRDVWSGKSSENHPWILEWINHRGFLKTGCPRWAFLTSMIIFRSIKTTGNRKQHQLPSLRASAARREVTPTCACTWGMRPWWKRPGPQQFSPRPEGVNVDQKSPWERHPPFFDIFSGKTMENHRL